MREGILYWVRAPFVDSMQQSRICLSWMRDCCIVGVLLSGFLQEVVVDFEGRVAGAVVAFGVSGLFADASGRFPGIGVGTAAMAFEFTMFEDKHLDAQSKHHQCHDGQRHKQGYE